MTQHLPALVLQLSWRLLVLALPVGFIVGAPISRTHETEPTALAAGLAATDVASEIPDASEFGSGFGTKPGVGAQNYRREPLHPNWLPAIVVGGAKLRPPDTPAAHIDPNVKSSPYAGVVSINTGLSGVLISRHHVLTAAHGVDQDGDGKQEIGTEHVKVHFNHNNPDCTTEGMVVIAAKKVDLHPDFTGFNKPEPNDDLAIITLASPAPEEVPVYPVFFGPPQPGFVIIMAGYGPSGTGEEHRYSSRFSFCTKRTGRNVASLYRPDDEESERLEMFQYDFDGPTKESDTFEDGPGLGNDVESIVSPGDSGGPSFLWSDANGDKNVDQGELIVLGVNTTIGGTVNGYTPFGSFAAGALASGYREWILGIVPAEQLQIVGTGKPAPQVVPLPSNVPGQAIGKNDAPRSLDPRVKIELFAQQPQIVTPTGIDVDDLGRVWVIESNTHFRPDDYKGHASDRLLVMSDTDADGRADKIVTFTDGLTHAMSVAVRPRWLASAKPGDDKKPAAISVYVATRKEIFLLHDDDGDLQADRKQRLVLLDTPGTYPHNGLGGLAFDPAGRLVFGLGENLGEKYKIVGSDGSMISGGGEGGNVYRCELDGSRLQHLATGFWNPHASCFDAFGRLFTVDNDPDALPPCRLIHIIPGGDYGYRFRFGRKGLHPFTCWNGEIPGTLPMVAGTGEAPSGVIAYESDGLPQEYVGNLLATSWGDHRVDRFRLKPTGASFTSLAEPVIIGGENFRPVGIACAPDGSLYCSDWVLSDYHVHGRGRVWRISAVDAPQRTVVDASTISARRPLKELQPLLLSPRMDVRRSAAAAMAQQAAGANHLLDILRKSASDRAEPVSKRVRVEALWALHRQAAASDQKIDAQRLAMRGPSDEVATAAHWLGHVRVSPPDTAAAVRSPSPIPPQEVLDLVTESSRTDTRSARAGGTRQPILDASLPLAAVSKLTFENYLDTGPFLRAKDPFVFATIVDRVARDFRDAADLRTRLAKAHHAKADHSNDAHPKGDGPSPRERLGWLLAMRRRDPRDTSFLKTFLADRDATVRRAAVQWVAEQRLEEFRPQIEAMLNDATLTSDLFLAVLATLELLDGKDPVTFDKTPAGKYVLPLVRDATRPAAVRAAALRLVASDDPALDRDLLTSLLSSEDATLRLETVRTLQHSPLPERGELLRGVAADEQAPVTLRAAAVLGLSGPALAANAGDASRELLRKLMHGDNGALRTESIRSLRQVAASDAELLKELNAEAKRLEAISAVTPANTERAEQLAFALVGADGQPAQILPGLRSTRPKDAASWHTALQSSGGDPAAGRRVFFHANSAGCYKCHTVNGRGGRVGPDLSTVGRTLNRRRLVDSILNPDQEIAPQFVAWRLDTNDGRVHSGIIVQENDGKTVIGDPEGALTELKTAEIAGRTAQQTSIMPAKLADRLTIQEFRDVIAYLESLR